MAEGLTPPFESLDFVYTPSSDVPADLEYFTKILGGRAVFAIDSDGTKVAAVELTTAPPLVVLADHLGDERPILVYRVGDLRAAADELELRGWKRERTLEIPHGPCTTFRTPGGQHVAIYEVTRPEVAAHFAGRADF